MIELKLTPARLKLLQAIADGAVVHGSSTIYIDCIGAGWPLGGSRYVKVTARVHELERAGWVAKRQREGFVVATELTDAGRTVLEAHRD